MQQLRGFASVINRLSISSERLMEFEFRIKQRTLRKCKRLVEQGHAGHCRPRVNCRVKLNCRHQICSMHAGRESVQLATSSVDDTCALERPLVSERPRGGRTETLQVAAALCCRWPLRVCVLLRVLRHWRIAQVGPLLLVGLRLLHERPVPVLVCA